MECSIGTNKEFKPKLAVVVEKFAMLELLKNIAPASSGVSD